MPSIPRWPAGGDGRGGRWPRADAEEAWHQHRDAPAIVLVAGAELRNQVPFLEPDADEDVSRGHDGEQQMPGGHVRRRPERDQKAQHQRVAYAAVEAAVKAVRN